MPNPTLATIRTEVAKLVTPRYQTGTPTSVAAGSLTHTALSVYGTDWFNNHYVLDSNGVVFYVTAFASATGVLTLRPTGTTPGSGTYEIMLEHPTRILDSINRMSKRAYPLLNTWYMTENLVTNSPIPDPGFEDWLTSSTLRAWTVTTSTLSRQTGALFGGWVARLGTLAGYLSLKTDFQTDMLALRNYTIDVHAWVKTSTASAGRINLRYVSQSGSATNNRSSYHTGGGGWERLSVTGVAIPSTVQTVDLRLENDTTSNVDFDDVWCEGGPMMPRLRISDALLDGPTTVMVAALEDRDFIRNFRYRRWPFTTFRIREDQPAGNNRYEIEFRHIPPALLRVRVEGPIPLPALSADTDTLLISDKEEQVLEMLSAIDCLDRFAMLGSTANHQAIRDNQAQLRAQLATVSRDLRAPVHGGGLNFDI